MQRLIVLAVAIGMVVLLASGAALAQEESLPDLTVDKTGPTTAAPDDFVTHYFDVTNVGSGDAILPSGATLVRDTIRVSGSFRHEFALAHTGGFPVGVTGIPAVLSSRQGASLSHNPTTFFIDEWNDYPTDAIISPGGGFMQFQTSINPPASGGRIVDCATVDPDNVIVESDESNNTDCFTTKIVP
jgi:hypothetical protein